MTTEDILNKHKSVIELHALSAAHAIMPTLCKYYTEYVPDEFSVKQYFIDAIVEATHRAYANPDCRGESVVLFRFAADVTVSENELKFDLSFKLNGANLREI